MNVAAETDPPASAEAPTTTSTLTAPSTPRARRVAARSNVTLFQLSNIPSPIKARDPAEEEAEYDRRCMEENAGASDSEEEPIDDDDDPLPNLVDQAACDEAKLAAELTDYVAVKVEDGQQEPWCYGAPIGWTPPGAPKDWKLPAPKTEKGEPESFDGIDNPGGCDIYSFQAKYDKRKKYVQHQLPTGVVPVPADEDGKRVIDGWEFHYNGWTKPPDNERQFRDAASRENMFPQFRRGSLDQNVLARLGLDVTRMRDAKGEPDSLFFYQLLLPIHHINKAKGILPVPDDPRDSFYCNVAKWTNLYAVGELDLGSGYGHAFQTTTAAEMVRWDGVLAMDGVRGGSHGAILRRFSNYPDSKAYDPDICQAFTKSRWLELKRTVKLCNNPTSPKKGHEDYDPAYKYDFIFKTLFHNVNALSLYACPDQCGDETTFGHQGHGEQGAGLVKYIKNKPGITKGMQMAMCSDVDWIRPRAYLHRHKKHPTLFGTE